MIPYFDAHCDTIYRCLETGETSALEYGEDREEQRRYYAASTHLRKNGGRYHRFSQQPNWRRLYRADAAPPGRDSRGKAKRIWPPDLSALR